MAGNYLPTPSPSVSDSCSRSQGVGSEEFHDADDYADPTAKAVMQCSDSHLQLMAQLPGSTPLLLQLARCDVTTTRQAALMSVLLALSANRTYEDTRSFPCCLKTPAVSSVR